MAGTIYKVSTNENIMPPTITIPNGIRLVEASPNDKASGNAPRLIARLVIKMGLSLAVAASVTAGIFLLPSGCIWLVDCAYSAPAGFLEKAISESSFLHF